MSNLLHHPAGLAAVAGLAVCVSVFAFVIWWALVGWGASIAVRTYRWAMRHHQPEWATPYVVEQYPVSAGRQD